MDVAVAGLDSEFQLRVADALLPGTRLVPCSVDALDGDRAGAYAAIILGPEIPLDTAIETAKAIDYAHPETSVVLVAPENSETLKAALRAGARDVWTPDVGPDEMSASLGEVLESSRHRSEMAAAAAGTPTARSEVIVVASAKGGLGQTMLATSLATCIATRTSQSVALVDLDLQFGDVAEVLQLRPRHDISDAAAALGNLPALKTMIAEHASGVHVLGVPEDPAATDDVSPETASRLVATLGSQFDVVIVDAGDGLTEHALSALDHATSIMVVTTPNPFVIRDTQSLLEIIDELPLTDFSRHLVLNHASDRSGLRRRELDEVLTWPITATLPSHSGVPQAMMRGRSLEDINRAFRKALHQMADSFTNAQGHSDPSTDR
jgi:pilus assembly protein CpaE